MGMYTTIIGYFKQRDKELIKNKIFDYVEKKGQKNTRIDWLLEVGDYVGEWFTKKEDTTLNEHAWSHFGYGENLFRLHIKKYWDSNEEIISLFEDLHDGMSDGYITFLYEESMTHTIHIIKGTGDGW